MPDSARVGPVGGWWSRSTNSFRIVSTAGGEEHSAPVHARLGARRAERCAEGWLSSCSGRWRRSNLRQLLAPPVQLSALADRAGPDVARVPAESDAVREDLFWSSGCHGVSRQHLSPGRSRAGSGVRCAERGCCWCDRNHAAASSVRCHP